MSWGREYGSRWLLRQVQAHELQVGLLVLVQAHLPAASRTATSRSGPSATSKGLVSLPDTARRQSTISLYRHLLHKKAGTQLGLASGTASEARKQVG